MQIIGAGLAGLLAGNLFQRAQLLEAGTEDQLQHRAVLRFRSSAIGDATGIEFQPVIVHKGLWLGDKFVRPSIQLANLYSQKVIGRIADRSIWNLEPAKRFIAPENLVAQLAERCAGRITWNAKVTEWHDIDDDTISTAPMPVLAKLLGVTSAPPFDHAPIVVRRWRIPNADVYQTIYFPDPAIFLYRASITGSLLIAEYAGASEAGTPEQDAVLMQAFGLRATPEPIDVAKQRFGKIAPIDEAWRRQFILNATLQHRIYSLGRFATWRNILLDDVLHDISVIKKLVLHGAYMATRSM